MAILNAASPDQTKKIKLSASTVGILQTRDNPTTIGDYQNFDTENRFHRYQQLIKSNPYSSIGMKKLRTSLTTGLDFDGKRRDVKEAQKWSKKVNFIGQAQTIAGSLFSYGTYVGNIKGTDPTKVKLQPLLMPYLTILPLGVAPGESPEQLLQPDPVIFIVNEKGNSQDASQTQIDYKPEQVVYGTIDEWESEQLDIKQRKTCGLYGESLVEPLEVKIRNYLDIERGYVTFVKKYGMGRYWYSFPFLERACEANVIDVTQFQDYIDEWMEKNKYLSENEDIVGWVEPKPIDAKGSLDVLNYKQSLESDISMGFFQSDLSMGDSKGSTYAAGYVSENTRLAHLENLQLNLKNVINDLLDKRSVMAGRTEGSVEVFFDELSLPAMTASEILEWRNNGLLSDEMALEWGGFPSKDVNANQEANVTPV